jgi:anti-anti-sigma factor
MFESKNGPVAVEMSLLRDDIYKIVVAKEKDEEGKVSGNFELDIYNEDSFNEIVSTLIDSGKINIVLDMTYILFMDSSGLWAIFDVWKKAAKENGIVVLMNPQKDVKRVFFSTKLSDEIMISNSENEAINLILEKRNQKTPL